MTKRAQLEAAHKEGKHRDRLRSTCPLCIRKAHKPKGSYSYRVSGSGWTIRPGFGYCTPAGIR